MALEVGTVQATITADTSGFDRAMKEDRKEGDKAASSISKRFSSIDLKRVGKQMTMGLTVPLAAVGGLAVKAAADLESSFTNVRKTVNATEAEFASMRSELIDLSETIPVSVNELNNLAGIAGQLGISNNSIVKFTETIAQLGVATDIAGEQAALSLSRLMNVAGVANEDIDRLGSASVSLGNNMASMESEIVGISNSLAPMANAIGISVQEILALSSTIAASGGQAEAAATAFQRMGNSIKTAVLTGNEDLQTFARVSGVSTSEFAKQFEEDAMGAIFAFLKGLNRINEQGGSVFQTLEKVGLGQQRMSREVGKVIGNLDGLSKALGISEKGWRDNNALTEEARKRFATFASQLKILRNRLSNLGAEIGQIMMPALKDLMDIADQVIVGFQSMSKSAKVFSVGIAAVAAAAGPVIGGLGLLSSALAAITWPVAAGAAIVAGLTAIGFNAFKAYSETKQLEETLNNLGDASLRAMTSSIDTIRGEIENIKEVAEELAFSEGTQQWATEKITKYRSELEKISTTATDKLVEGIDNITAAQRRVVQKTIGAGELGKAKDYLDTIVEGAEAEGVKAGTDMAKGFKKSFTESMGGGQSIPAPTVMYSGVVKKEAEKTKLELQGLSNTINSLNFDVGNKMFPQGSLVALQEKLAVLREKLLYATNPASIQHLKNQISLTREEMNK